METLSKKTVLETLEASQSYSGQLESLLSSIKIAENQVGRSACKSAEKVSETFNEIKQRIIAILSEKEELALATVRKHEKDAMAPLAKCHEEINKCLTTNNKFLEDIKSVLKCGGFQSDVICSNFMENHSKLGSLPEVPDLEFVSNISFFCDAGQIVHEISQLLNNIGSIYKIAPVQITSIDPKPGAVLIKWEEVDFENQADNPIFRLQCSSCDVTVVGSFAESSFQDAYTGPDLEFLQRNLRPGQCYSFRVSSCFNSEWSPWSMIKVGKTDIPPFSWEANKNFLIANEGKLGKSIGQSSLLFSSGAQIGAGDAVQFTLCSSIQPKEIEGVGLSISKNINDVNLMQSGVFFVSFTGQVYVDGVKKIICLPTMTKDSKIIFTCEAFKKKWRIAIESDEKVVTYEWSHDVSKLHFVAFICQQETCIMVE